MCVCVFGCMCVWVYGCVGVWVEGGGVAQTREAWRGLFYALTIFERRVQIVVVHAVQNDAVC